MVEAAYGLIRKCGEHCMLRSIISAHNYVYMCVLASPSAGHRLRWGEILGLVKTRIQRWLDGDLVALGQSM